MKDVSQRLIEKLFFSMFFLISVFIAPKSERIEKSWDATKRSLEPYYAESWNTAKKKEIVEPMYALASIMLGIFGTILLSVTAIINILGAFSILSHSITVMSMDFILILSFFILSLITYFAFCGYVGYGKMHLKSNLDVVKPVGRPNLIGIALFAIVGIWLGSLWIS